MRYGQTAIVFLPTLVLAGVLLLLYGIPEQDADPLSDEIRSYETFRDLLLAESLVDVTGRELIYNALKGMARSIPYTYFYTPDEKDFDEEVFGEYMGPGISPRIVEGRLIVNQCIPGSSASQSPPNPDWEILDIDGVSTQGMSVDKVRALLRGDGVEGSVCQLTLRSWNPLQIHARTLERTRIRPPAVTAGILLDENEKIGYLRIDRFLTDSDSCFREIRERLIRSGMRSLVIDLRFNHGGVLESALKVAEQFITGGLLLYVRSSHSENEETVRAKDRDPSQTDHPLVVLINEETASAAEALAGILQDYRRAVLIGTRSLGKGVIQACTRQEMMGEEVVVKIPVGLFFLPSGRCIERRLRWKGYGGIGLDPDIFVPISSKEKQELEPRLRDILSTYDPGWAGKSRTDPVPDPQLEAACAFLRGERICSPLFAKE